MRGRKSSTERAAARVSLGRRRLILRKLERRSWEKRERILQLQASRNRGVNVQPQRISIPNMSPTTIHNVNTRLLLHPPVNLESRATNRRESISQGYCQVAAARSPKRTLEDKNGHGQKMSHSQSRQASSTTSFQIYFLERGAAWRSGKVRSSATRVERGAKKAWEKLTLGPAENPVMPA